MKIVLVSECSLDIEQHVEFKMSVLISPSKSLISSRWVTCVMLMRSSKMSEVQTFNNFSFLHSCVNYFLMLCLARHPMEVC